MSTHLVPTSHARRRGATAVVAVAVAGLLLGTAACSSDDDEPAAGPSVTSAPVVTSAASVVPAPTTTAPPAATVTAPTPTTAAPTSTATSDTAPGDPARQAMLQGILDAHHAAGDFVGARMALLDPDGTVTEVVAGTAGTDPAMGPVDPDVAWNVGSVTKTFVAVVVLQLADEGRLDLDAGIDRFLPDLPDAARITPRQLLQHTSGLAEYLDQPAVVSDLQRPWTPAELVAVAETAGRTGEPGAAHHYSNTNYLVLGDIIEQVTGHPWADEVRTRIAEPLGLTGTGVITDQRPTGYQVVDGALVDTTSSADPSVGGAGGALLSTDRDLLRFAAALADGSLLSPASQTAMQSFVPGEDLSAYGIVHGYGLGLERYESDAVTVVGHMGTGEAQSAFVGFDPLEGTVIAVQTNTAVAGPQALMAAEALAAARMSG